MKNNFKLIVIGFGLSLFASMAAASSVTIPNNFTAGTAAVAAEVNGNFSAVKSAVDDNDSRLNTLEAGTVSFSAYGLMDDIDDDTCRIKRSDNSVSYFTGSGDLCKAYMPISLPNGRTLTSFSCAVLDSDGNGTNNIDSAGLQRTSLLSGATTTVFQTSGSVESASVQQITDATAATGTAVVDNGTYVYRLFIPFDEGLTLFSNVRVYGCKVTYI